MRVLITGGAGFIGSALAGRLLSKGHAVVIVDNLSTGHRENIPTGAEFLKIDLADRQFPEQLPSSVIDAVCHLAGQSSGAGSMEDPYYDLQANTASTILLSQWCLAKQVPRFIFASSMAVYGNVETLPASEEALCRPCSYYGVSKFAAEHALRVVASQGLSVTVLRLFSVYGPGQDLNRLTQGMASIYLSYLLRGVPVPVTGSLERFRDFVYIDDVVDAWQLALARPRTRSHVYNVCSGRPTTVRQLLNALIRAMDLPADYPIQELTGSPADQFGVYGDMQRTQSELGFVPRFELSEGLRMMVQWARGRSADYETGSDTCRVS